MLPDGHRHRRMLRTREAAEYTGLAKSTLEKLRVHGGGCPYIRIGRVVVYDPADLDAWLASHRRVSTSDIASRKRRHMAWARKPNQRGIKIHRNYSVDEAARVTGYAEGTIRRWIRSGSLPALVDRKPILILGGDFSDYFDARKRSGPKLRAHECYCLKCRAPREPALGMADYVPLTKSTGNLRALCGACGSLMHKAIRAAALAALRSVLDVTAQEADRHIEDSPSPSLDDHLDKEPNADA